MKRMFRILTLSLLIPAHSLHAAGSTAVTMDGVNYRADTTYQPGGFGHIGGLVALGSGQTGGSPLDSCRWMSDALPTVST